MSIPSIDITTIQSHTTTQSFTRVKSYYREGAVFTLTQRGKSLHGRKYKLMGLLQKL